MVDLVRVNTLCVPIKHQLFIQVTMSYNVFLTDVDFEGYLDGVRTYITYSKDYGVRKLFFLLYSSNLKYGVMDLEDFNYFGDVRMLNRVPQFLRMKASLTSCHSKSRVHPCLFNMLNRQSRL